MSLTEKVINKQAKKSKKLFEKVVPFYPYKKDNQMYILIRYSRLDKATGDLILTAQGNVLPYKDAIPIFRDFTWYDSNIYDSLDFIDKDKDKPLDRLKEILHLFHTVVIPVVNQMDATNIKKDMDTISEMANAYISAKDRCVEIIEAYKAMDIKVQDKGERGYLTKEDVEKSITLNKEWVVMSYDKLRKARNALEAYPRFIAFCVEHSDALNNKRANTAQELQELLADLIDPANVEVLEKSLQRFEVDETEASPRSFSDGEKGLGEFEENYARTADYMFKTKLLPRLRNP